MPMLRIVTQPSIEPVSLTEAKLHCRIDVNDDDWITASLIRTARAYAEQVTRRGLLTQTWDLYLDDWPEDDRIVLPRPPLQSVTHVKYTTSAGVLTTFSSASYTVGVASEPGRLVLNDGYSWPTDTLQVVDGITVRFVAGWTSSADVPMPIRQAILMTIGHWYENRESTTLGAVSREVPYGVDALLWPYRVLTF